MIGVDFNLAAAARTRSNLGRVIRAAVAGIAHAVAVRVGLREVSDDATVVAGIAHAVPLGVLLTRVDVPGVSGLEGVEWDAVELPSQFMENFCWEWDVLRHMTAHVETGAALPRALFDNLLAAKNFQSGMQTVRQLEFALFDMHLHHDFAQNDSLLGLVAQIRREVAVIPRPEYDRSLTHAFSHIFAGGYAAGYYSYKWAEVLSADAYSLFEEQGVLSPEVGGRFRDEVLARGGSRPALESFIAFRGRPPQMDALLRHNGMSTS